MTNTRKELKAEIRRNQQKDINTMKSGAILWFLVRRHSDHITIFSCALAFGLIIGSKV